jgi:hypothetical protein
MKADGNDESKYVHMDPLTSENFNKEELRMN